MVRKIHSKRLLKKDYFNKFTVIVLKVLKKYYLKKSRLLFKRSFKNYSLKFQDYWREDLWLRSWRTLENNPRLQLWMSLKIYASKKSIITDMTVLKRSFLLNSRSRPWKSLKNMVKRSKNMFKILDTIYFLKSIFITLKVLEKHSLNIYNENPKIPWQNILNKNLVYSPKDP